MNNTIDLNKKRIEEFFNDDVLDFSLLPIEAVRKHLQKFGIIDTSIIENIENKKAYKDLLLSIILTNKPYTYKSKSHSLSYVFKLPNFFASLKDTSFVDMDRDNLKAMFKGYCIENYLAKSMQKIIVSCQEAVLEYRDPRTGFDRDLWDSSIIKVAPERLNKSISFYSINFRLIKNVTNREYVKLYIRHLIGHTEMAYSTIYGFYSIILQFCRYIDSTNLPDVTKNQVMEYIQKLSSKSVDLRNSVVNILSDFYKYLGVKQLLDKPNPVTKDMRIKPQYNTINNTVEEYTILQIFNHIHKAPFNLQLMFLINYCTGMRVSDVCQIKKDCLFDDGEGGYYIEFACQKMQKPLRNLIPQALFDLVKEQINIINSLDYEETYLFPSPRKKNHPYATQTFRNKFKKLCHEWGIKNPDESDYNYTTHAYRHTIATDLYQNYNVPITIIQKAVLGHKELQMTLSYVERPDEFKKLQEDKYIEKTGEVKLSKWLKDNLRGRILPNGICGQPESLGACPAADACLSCQYFKTSKSFLPILKNQLDTIQSRLPIYEANNWIPNIETAKEQISILTGFIERLEEKEDIDGSN